ncbi:V-type proton ATPase subunit S1-like [Cyprinodon tularosa]|uniref:ATPase H+ transporting accessory protein 1 like n=1 Tax=Cyprinodon variegatus TaxID=28743 RepID=A0A3Q2CCH2_CYPVA|nr:PREDICTED: V-type proton ATPase subunit S1-like protein [Cyprinodon variegatus]XP_038135571.1 V-type proton ATPase subunit S1-like [Cyprinodon tularosa]
MASLWKHLWIFVLHLDSSASFQQQPASSKTSVVQESNMRMRNEEQLVFAVELENLHLSQRKLLQTTGAALPFSPLKVESNGEPCILFQARKFSLRFEKQKPVDLTELTFSPQKLVDTRESLCQQETATLVMRFGDVENLGDLSIRFQLSNTFYESSGQWWFSVDRVSVLTNSSEVVFNATDVYAPASSSYRCLHVSSLQRYSGLLLPSTEQAQRWAITFIDFQIQAFNISSGRFSPASNCSTVLTPAILMGLITSLILLLVLAYALHMVVHLKHIEHDDDQKADIYFPQSPEQLDRCCEESCTEKNGM